ncbi:hypothetical protein LguiA_016897 [Lonicera macranthoides]
MALTFASLASLRLSKRASCRTASTSSKPRNAGNTNTNSPTLSCLFSLSPFLSSPQQVSTICVCVFSSMLLFDEMSTHQLMIYYINPMVLGTQREMLGSRVRLCTQTTWTLESKGLRVEAYGNPTTRERAEGNGCSCVDQLVDD